MMHRLRHDRVVKLLGIIIEEGNYALVMEYMTKGNLMRVLKAEVERALLCTLQAQQLGCWLSVSLLSWYSFVACWYKIIPL